MDGVVRAPSAFSITFGVLPSITATQELVVPRSMPMALAMRVSFRAGLTWKTRPRREPTAGTPGALHRQAASLTSIFLAWLLAGFGRTILSTPFDMVACTLEG